MENITQRELAQKLGLLPSFLSRILSGNKRPSTETAARLERKSGVSRVTWLYAKPLELRKSIESTLGRKINFKRGRPRPKV